MGSESNILHSVSLADSPPRVNFPVLHQVPTSQANTSDEDDGDLDPAEFLSHDVIINSGTLEDPGSVEAPSRSPIDQIPTSSEHEFFLNPLVFSDRESLGFITVDNNGREDSESHINNHPNSRQTSRNNTPGLNTEPKSRHADRLKPERDAKYTTNSIGGTGPNPQNSFQDLKGDPSFEDSIFNSSRLSNLLPNNFFDIQRIQHSPVEYLINRGKLLQEELSMNLQTQKHSLLQGQGNLARVRKMILQDFEQLSDNGTMLAEAYSSDLQYVLKMYDSFEAWNVKREEVLLTISAIKSPKSKYGSKLEALANESDNIDSEMEDLQTKLASLRQRKRAIVDEIQQTSSILESRTLSFVETFRHLEEEGEVAIRSMLDLNGVSKFEQDKFIQRTPVDVSFGGKRARDNVKKVPIYTNQAITSTDLASKAKSGDGAFHKGFAMGSRQTNAAKKKLVQVFNNLILQYDGGNVENVDINQFGKPQLDDTSNTIQSKLSYDHVRTLLQLKILALQDVIQANKEMSTVSTECSIVWNDVVSEVKNMEDALSNVISHSSGESILKEMTSPILEASVKVLQERVETLAQRRKTIFERNPHTRVISDLVLTGIFNEAGAISSALNLVTGNKTQIQRLDALKQKIGFSNPNEPILQGKNAKSAVEPTGYLNKPIIDYRKQAESELAKTLLSNAAEGRSRILKDGDNKDKKL